MWKFKVYIVERRFRGVLEKFGEGVFVIWYYSLVISIKLYIWIYYFFIVNFRVIFDNSVKIVVISFKVFCKSKIVFIVDGRGGIWI